MDERWLPIVGSDGYYEVSDLGNVRSWHKTGCSTCRAVKPKLLKPKPDTSNSGRLVVGIKMADGTYPTFRVHRLVAAAFLGPCPPGLEVCHNDGNAGNNRLANLRYDTRSSNLMDRVAHGTHGRGEANAQHILTEREVREIRALASARSVSQDDIAAQFGISQSLVSNIHLRRAWGWLA